MHSIIGTMLLVTVVLLLPVEMLLLFTLAKPLALSSRLTMVATLLLVMMPLPPATMPVENDFL